MSRPPGVLTKKLIALWIVTVGCVASLWGLAQLADLVPNDLVLIWDLNPQGTPRPEMFGALLGLATLGIVCILGNILLRLRDSDQTINLASFILALAASGGAVFFVYSVLDNNDAIIPPSSSTKKSLEPAAGLRLFNLNVLHGYPDFEEQDRRLEQTAALIRSLKPSIMVLQEVWNTNEHRNMAERLCATGAASRWTHFNYAYARANGSRPLIGFEEGSAIASLDLLPVLSAKRYLLQPKKPWWENRIALFARIDLGGEETLKVIGVHLSNSASADGQADHLAEILRGQTPDLVAGDLNSRPDSHAVQAIKSVGYVEIIPTKALLGSKSVALPTVPAIDHVFMSDAFAKRWRVTSAIWIITSKPVIDEGPQVVGRPWGINTRTMAVSDHDAILVDFERR